MRVCLCSERLDSINRIKVNVKFTVVVVVGEISFIRSSLLPPFGR